MMTLLDVVTLWNRGIQPNTNERKCLANSGGIGNSSPVSALAQVS